MQAVTIIIQVIEYALIAYFGIASVYIFIFAFAGHFYKRRDYARHGKINKFAVLIPGYKEDDVILEVAKSALLQKYALNRFDVIVVADSFFKKTIAELKVLPVILVEVGFEKSTKSKALNKAMVYIGDNYDIALILDADNIMEPLFLAKVNEAFNQGYKVVQGHRIAKNLNTSFAILDAISEEVNNHIFRKGHRSLGLSSGLIGSGMAFEYQFFKSIMSKVNAIGGFDKALEFKLLKDGYTIEYLNEALVYDEKIQRPEDFNNQRKRWLSTQFVYLRKNFFPGLKALLLKGNINLFDKVYQMIAPPRILLLGMVLIITLCYFVFDLFVSGIEPNVTALFWYATLLITVLAFVMAIPVKFYNSNTLRALILIPKAFLMMFLLLFKLKGANNKFIHTKHGTINN